MPAETEKQDRATEHRESQQLDHAASAALHEDAHSAGTTNKVDSLMKRFDVSLEPPGSMTEQANGFSVLRMKQAEGGRNSSLVERMSVASFMASQPESNAKAIIVPYKNDSLIVDSKTDTNSAISQFKGIEQRRESLVKDKQLGKSAELTIKLQDGVAHLNFTGQNPDAALKFALREPQPSRLTVNGTDLGEIKPLHEQLGHKPSKGEIKKSVEVLKERLVKANESSSAEKTVDSNETKTQDRKRPAEKKEGTEVHGEAIANLAPKADELAKTDEPAKAEEPANKDPAKLADTPKAAPKDSTVGRKRNVDSVSPKEKYDGGKTPVIAPAQKPPRQVDLDAKIPALEIDSGAQIAPDIPASPETTSYRSALGYTPELNADGTVVLKFSTDSEIKPLDRKSVLERAGQLEAKLFGVPVVAELEGTSPGVTQRYTFNPPTDVPSNPERAKTEETKVMEAKTARTGNPEIANMVLLMPSTPVEFLSPEIRAGMPAQTLEAGASSPAQIESTIALHSIAEGAPRGYGETKLESGKALEHVRGRVSALMQAAITLISKSTQYTPR